MRTGGPPTGHSSSAPSLWCASELCGGIESGLSSLRGQLQAGRGRTCADRRLPNRTLVP